MADDTNSAACSSTIECFIQTLALYQSAGDGLCIENVIFSGNTATEHGSNLFRGLLGRCIPSPVAEVYQEHNSYSEEDLSYRIWYNGVTYLRSISDITLDSIASLPVRVCFCNNEGGHGQTAAPSHHTSKPRKEKVSPCHLLQLIRSIIL